MEVGEGSTQAIKLVVKLTYTLSFRCNYETNDKYKRADISCLDLQTKCDNWACRTVTNLSSSQPHGKAFFFFMWSRSSLWPCWFLWVWFLKTLRPHRRALFFILCQSFASAANITSPSFLIWISISMATVDASKHSGQSKVIF